MSATLRVAAAQLAPAYLDRDASLDIALDAIAQAGEEGARLLVFPETFLPGYPYFAITHDPTETDPFLNRLRESAVEVSSPTTQKLCEAAQAAGCFVVMGLHEREGGTLFNSQLLISEEGEVVGVRRKLVPTNHERMIWGRGDGSDLQVYDTSFGRLGALICYEHGNALFRYAIQGQGEQIHVAMWPGGMGGLMDIIDAAVRHYAFEGQCFVVNSTSILTEAILDTLESSPSAAKLKTGAGRSMIVDPRGRVLAEAAPDEETILYADLDLTAIDRAKAVIDSCGHYARPDVATLRVDRRKKTPLELTD
jgi:aliphatic nitrilase